MVSVDGWGEGGGGGGVENRAGGYSAQDKVIREVLERLLSTLAPTEGCAIRKPEPYSSIPRLSPRNMTFFSGDGFNLREP